MKRGKKNPNGNDAASSFLFGHVMHPLVANDPQESPPKETSIHGPAAVDV